MKKQIVFMKCDAQKGFTLIELMIVIAIIGILAAFSAMMFQDYVVRTRVAEGLVLASGAKNIVADNAANGFPANQGWNWTAATTSTDNIQIAASTGVITVTGSTKAKGIILALIPSDINGPLTAVGTTIPEGRISWRCTASGYDSLNQVPAECR